MTDSSAGSTKVPVRQIEVYASVFPFLNYAVLKNSAGYIQSLLILLCTRIWQPAGIVVWWSSYCYDMVESRWSFRRRDKATMVSVGLAWPQVGNTELPSIYRFCKPWTLRLEFTTPSLALLCIRVVPI